MKKTKKRYPFYDFIAAMAFVFDVDWDDDYKDMGLEEAPAAIGILPESAVLAETPVAARSAG